MESRYKQASRLSNQLEQELKRINRWSEQPLAPERYENMGAFGSNTMTFEEWIQFILIERIRDIVKTEGEFPDESMLAPYAIRVFDTDPEAHSLHDILYELDELINSKPDVDEVETTVQADGPPGPTVMAGSDKIPDVLFTLAGLLHVYEESDLESQLQTFDIFLSILSPSVRPAISDMIGQAATRATNAGCRLRLEKAAASVAHGGKAAI